jgi:hypothetical protein
MNDKLKAKRKKLLQKVADFIYVMLEITMETGRDDMFDFWIWQGLSLDYWCVEHDIWLD